VQPFTADAASLEQAATDATAAQEWLVTANGSVATSDLEFMQADTAEHDDVQFEPAQKSSDASEVVLGLEQARGMAADVERLPSTETADLDLELTSSEGTATGDVLVGLPQVSTKTVESGLLTAAAPGAAGLEVQVEQQQTDPYETSLSGMRGEVGARQPSQGEQSEAGPAKVAGKVLVAAPGEASRGADVEVDAPDAAVVDGALLEIERAGDSSHPDIEFMAQTRSVNSDFKVEFIQPKSADRTGLDIEFVEQAALPPREAPQAYRIGMTVLIAQHDTESVAIIREAAELRKMQLLGVARDGEQALSDALRLKPDVLCLDLHLEKRDGLQVLAELRKSQPELKVMMMTATATVVQVRRAIDLRVSTIIVKPFSVSRVAADLARLA
jgi:CheY-like chemotaxis protein